MRVREAAPYVRKVLGGGGPRCRRRVKALERRVAARWKERPDGGFEQEQVAALVLERERQDLAQSAALAAFGLINAGAIAMGAWGHARAPQRR